MRSSEFHEHKEWGRRWDCAGGKKANVRTTGCGHTSVNTCTHTRARTECFKALTYKNTWY